MKKKKQIKDLENDRMGLFMTDNSFHLDMMYGQNFLQTDNAQKVKLHKINVVKTKTHDLYGQAKTKDKKFMPPVTLSVMITVADGSQEYYGGNAGGITRDDTGALTFGVYLTELEDKGVDFDRGDIIEYNLSGDKDRYYEIEDMNSVTAETSKTLGGFKNYWKRVSAVPVKEDVVPFLSETKGT